MPRTLSYDKSSRRLVPRLQDVIEALFASICVSRRNSASLSEQLKTRLNLRVDNIEKLTAEELRAQVDSAVGQLVNPLKMKSQLVSLARLGQLLLGYIMLVLVWLK